MLKTTQSFDGSLGLQSTLSPIRNNKYSKFYQTAASSQYSEFTNNSTLFKLNSGRSLNQQLQFPKLIKLQSAINIQTTPRQVSESRLRELQQMQKWVSQSFSTYHDGQRLMRDNEEKIRIMEHKNRLKKDQIIHIKSMNEYFRQKYQQCKKRFKNKLTQQQSRIKLKIKQSKQRTYQLYEQIQEIKSEINQQKRLQIELKIKSRRKTQQSQIGAMPFFYPHYGYPNMYMHPQFQNLQTIPNNFHNPNLHSFHPNFIQKNPEDIAIESKTHSMAQLKRSPSFDNQTARFLSKKVSFQGQKSEPINNNLIIQALAAQIGRITNPTSRTSGSLNLKKSDGGLSGKWQNFQQQKDVLNMMQQKKKKEGLNLKFLNKKNITISQDFQSSIQHNQYSPTNVVQTPGFDLDLNQNLKGKGGASFSSIHQQYQQRTNPHSSSTSTPHKRQSNKRTIQNVQQSKIRIQVDDSLSQYSKFSLQKRKKQTEQNGLKQSSIKIDVFEDDSRSGDNSMQKDAQQNSARSRRKSITAAKPVNDSIENIQLQQRYSSQILGKKNQIPINPPPKLPLQKKLRKVTQQQSDLFDSYGQPRTIQKEKKANNNKVSQKNQNSVDAREKSDTVSIRDVFLDHSNIKQSIVIPFALQTIPTSRTMKQEKVEEGADNQKINKKKQTQEEDDDDDFMNVNLLAVSKISKQKQLSERAFNTMSDEGNQSVKKNLIRHSYTPQQKPFNKSQIPFEDIIEEQNDFYDDEKEKRQNNLKRARKNSGSRFSILFEPNAAQSMELKIDQNIDN